MFVVLLLALATVLSTSGAVLRSRANPTRRLPWFARPAARPWPSVVLAPLAVVPMVLAANRLEDTHGDAVAVLLTWPVPLGSAVLVQALHNRAVARAGRA